MSWGSAGALAGLLFLALPIVIHLLGRDPAIRRVFPSLRFIEASRLLPTRWSKIHDPFLLAFRCAILACAVLALARPSRPAERDGPEAVEKRTRVLLLDTASSGGPEARRAAVATAKALLDSATSGVLVLTADPVAELEGAADWLRAEPGRGEIVLLSEFERSRFPADGELPVPGSIGVKTIRLQAGGGPRSAEPPMRTDGALPVELLVGDEESGFRDATLNAVRASLERAAGASGLAVAIVTPGYPRRDALLQHATMVSDPALIRVVTRLARDPFALPLNDTVRSGAHTIPATAVPVARGRAGGVVLWAVQDSAGKAPRLLLFTEFPPRSSALAQVISDVVTTRADPRPSSGAELLPDSALRRWERHGSAQVTTPGPIASESRGERAARLLWALALILLGAEWWVRRRSKSADPVDGGADALA